MKWLGELMIVPWQGSKIWLQMLPADSIKFAAMSLSNIYYRKFSNRFQSPIYFNSVSSPHTIFSSLPSFIIKIMSIQFQSTFSLFLFTVIRNCSYSERLFILAMKQNPLIKHSVWKRKIIVGDIRLFDIELYFGNIRK